MANNNDRPFDALQSAINANVLVHLKEGQEFRGILKAFDIHMNLVMDDTVVLGDKEIKLGRVVLRGDTIVYVSPEV